MDARAVSSGEPLDQRPLVGRRVSRCWSRSSEPARECRLVVHWRVACCAYTMTAAAPPRRPVARGNLPTRWTRGEPEPP